MQDGDNNKTYLGLTTNQIYSLFDDNTVIEFAGGIIGVHNLNRTHLGKNVDSISLVTDDGIVVSTMFSFRNLSIYEFPYIKELGIPDKIIFKGGTETFKESVNTGNIIATEIVYNNVVPHIEGQANVAKFIAEEMESGKDDVFGFFWNKGDYHITMQRLPQNQTSIYYKLVR